MLNWNVRNLFLYWGRVYSRGLSDIWSQMYLHDKKVWNLKSSFIFCIFNFYLTKLIWRFDLIWFDLIWFDLIWFDLRFEIWDLRFEIWQMNYRRGPDKQSFLDLDKVRVYSSVLWLQVSLRFIKKIRNMYFSI